MKKYLVETYDEEYVLIDSKTKNLMQLRVFCEQEMYPKLHSGEFSYILIMPSTIEDEEDK